MSASDEKERAGFWTRVRGLVSRTEPVKGREKLKGFDAGDDPDYVEWPIDDVEEAARSEEQVAPRTTSSQIEEIFQADAPPAPQVAPVPQVDAVTLEVDQASPARSANQAGENDEVVPVAGATRPVIAQGPRGETLAARIETTVGSAVSEAMDKRATAIARLQEGFNELTQLLTRIGDGLEGQGERDERIIAQLEQLPEILAQLPEAAGRESEILGTIEREIRAQSEWGKAMSEALGDLPRLIEVVDRGSPTAHTQVALMRGMSREMETQGQQRSLALRVMQETRDGVGRLQDELAGFRVQGGRMVESLDKLGSSLERLECRAAEERDILREVVCSSEAGRRATLASGDALALAVNEAIGGAQQSTVEAFERLDADREERFRKVGQTLRRQAVVVTAGFAVMVGAGVMLMSQRFHMEQNNVQTLVETVGRQAKVAEGRYERREAELDWLIDRFADRGVAAPAPEAQTQPAAGEAAEPMRSLDATPAGPEHSAVPATMDSLPAPEAGALSLVGGPWAAAMARLSLEPDGMVPASTEGVVAVAAKRGEVGD